MSVQVANSAEAPLVSIIMPAYNAANYLQQSIDSVIEQSYQNWKLIIVDDASNDSTFDIACRAAENDKRIIVKRLDKNSGPAAARNTALGIATGKYIAFIDSDDEWETEKLSFQLSIMEEEGLSFSCTSYLIIDEEAKSETLCVVPPKKTSYISALLFGNPIGNSTVVISRNVLNGLSIPQIRKRNDFALWLRILAKGENCIGIPKVLTKYRKRSGSLSADKTSLIPYQWELYREHEHFSLFVSVFFLMTWALSKSLGLGARKTKLRNSSSRS